MAKIYIIVKMTDVRPQNIEPDEEIAVFDENELETFSNYSPNVLGEAVEALFIAQFPRKREAVLRADDPNAGNPFVRARKEANEARTRTETYEELVREARR